MEITHLFRKSKLFFHLFLIPAFESSESIFRESTAMIDFQHSIQNRFYRFQSQRCIHNRRHRSGESPDQIGIRQNKIPYSRFLFTEFNPCRLDDISDLHIRRTGHFTPLAIDTIFQGLVIKTELLQTQAFSVRTCLFRTGIIRIDSRYRTINRTNRTFDALFEIIVTNIMLLKIHNLFYLLKICSATYKALKTETPPPHPSLIGLNPSRTAPATYKFSNTCPCTIPRKSVPVFTPKPSYGCRSNAFRPYH